ncbi:MAG: glycine cleavage system protein GcvH [Desulfovibrio sp.]|nr:glycine cleavage system protein GcvH [Desulfovibrio sp.]
MKTPDQINLPADLRYHKEHTWIKKDGDTCLVGISDYAQDQLGEVAFVDMPQAGTHFNAGDEFGTVESLKSVNALFMPVSGTVVEVNAALEDTPTLVNASCYGEGWIIRIKADDAAEADGLLDGEAYRRGL